MPVEFRNIEPPSTWQIFPRHPAGAEYPDLGKKLAQRMRDGIGEYGVMLRPVVLKREQNGLFVLDGWQMYKACIAVDVKPEFVELIAGIESEKFVEIKNDVRRHETDAEFKKRSSERRKRVKAAVAKKVASGTPATDAADEVAADEDVSRATVYRDLAHQPPRCERCEQKGESGDNCAACQLLQMDWTPPVPVPTVVANQPETRALDQNFVVVPDHVLDAFLVAERVAKICHKMDKEVIKELAEILNGKVGSRAISPTAAQRLAEVRQHLWQSRPTYVCCYCQGQMQKADCTECQGQGWQSAAKFATAPKEYQDAMRRIGARNVPI